jgi:hypothetical protein
MTLTTWIIAVLSFSLPSEYALVGKSSDRIERPGPPGLFATQEFRSWQAPDGKFVALFYWVPSAPRDGGPMVVAHETPAVVAGQKTKIIETTQFMGPTQRVVVTHLRFTDPEATAMIYAKGVSVEEFRSLLVHLSVVKAGGSGGQ